MKYGISLIVGIMFLFGIQFNAFSADSKIGVVDLQKLRKSSSAYQKLGESFARELEPQKNELEQLNSSLMKLKEELNKQSMMMSFGAQVDKEKELRQKERRLQYLMKEYQQEVQFIEGKILRSLSSDLIKIVGEIAKKEDYAMILEKGRGAVLYHSDSIDITDKVIKAYDQMKR